MARNVVIYSCGDAEEITPYEADCLRAAFLVVDHPGVGEDGIMPGDLTLPSGYPVGREPYGSVTYWHLVRRLLARVRSHG